MILCPHCASPVEIGEQDETVICLDCNQQFSLAGHVCPDCHHYHKAKTAVCGECGQTINQVCRHCQVVNWAGNEICRQCDRPLDIFELMVSHSDKATPDRLDRQMKEARTYKKTEEEASRKRMTELQAIEDDRQAELQLRLQKKRREERMMLLFAVGAIAFFLILILAYAILS